VHGREQPHLPEPEADAVPTLLVPVERPPLFEFADETVNGRKGQPSAAGQFGQGQPRVEHIEGSEKRQGAHGY
jgi:hypothetical protein